MGDTVITIGDRPKPPFPIETFRHLFVETDEQAELTALRDSGSATWIKHLCAPFDYIEDENGARISERDASTHLVRKVAGENYVLWDLDTMLVDGPKPMANSTTWSEDGANALNHFLRVVEAIFRSNWIRQPLHLTWHRSGNDEQIAEVQLPTDEATRSICMLFRQMFSDHKGDRLMERACETYAAHSSLQIRATWVKQQHARFKEMLESPPHFGGITEPLSHLLESFLYGCKVMHAKSSHDAEAQMLALCKRYGPENVAMEIQSGLRFLAGVAAQAYHVIKLDFDDWMSSGARAKPSSLDPADLLKSWRSEEF